MLRSRILKQADLLSATLLQLNSERKRVFGTIETKVLATERVTTKNNCIPWDMYSFGDQFLFGYNVHVGLRSEVTAEDVFSLFGYQEDHSFSELPLNNVLDDSTFLEDFQKLYKYYKHTQFLRFAEVGPFLHMVFRIGKDVKDIKTFKWEIKEGRLKYVDNRSDHEYRFPPQHEFEWQRTRREDFREGLHPHVSIKDRVFVETVGGDLTVKIEDNTEDGQGIYREEVENEEQTLVDGDFQYAELGSLIVLKIRPYQEEARFLVFNEKLHEVRNVPSMKEACILLPDNHGLIFSNGYYLQSGEHKQFDYDLSEMLFERRITSINGEDYLYVFYNREQGVFLLLNYNIIAQSVQNPIVCHGFTIFENGEMCVFKADEEPKKHHAIQVWQTPFTGPNFQTEEKNDSFLQKIGNKEVVRAMAECHDIINLLQKEEVYGDLYLDVIKKCTDILDSYHWLSKEAQYDLAAPLKSIRQVGESTIDEYEKVRKLKENSAAKLKELEKSKTQLVKKAKASFSKITAYVDLLASIRALRGEVISAKDLRYVDLKKLETFDSDLSDASDTVSESCVRFLMQSHALQPFIDQVSEFGLQVEKIEKVVEAEELLDKGSKVASELDLLIETVSNLKISDATQTTRIIENISDIYASYNQVKTSLTNRRKSLLVLEGQAEFSATLKLLEQSVTNYLDICDTPEKCEEYLSKLIVQTEELESKFSEFDDFLDVISQKREEVYNAFEARKLYLTEQRSKKANQLFQSAERVLSAIKNKAGTLKSKEEINGYFASDLMVAKVRNIAEDLTESAETVKADDLISQLKTLKEDVLRQFKDKQELFVDGANIISMGNYKFSTNQLSLDLSLVIKNKIPHFHLAGTDFFEAIGNARLNELNDIWEQSLISENDVVYRAEYLAFSILQSLLSNAKDQLPEDLPFNDLASYLELIEEEQIDAIQKIMTARYQEGYVKGIHEYDTHSLLTALVELTNVAGTLRFSPADRSIAKFYWNSCANDEIKRTFLKQIKAAAIILSVFPSSREFEGLVADIEAAMMEHEWLQPADTTSIHMAAQYLFHELASRDHFLISAQADVFYQSFLKSLKAKRAETKFKQSLTELREHPELALRTSRKWLQAFLINEDLDLDSDYLDEVATLLLYQDHSPAHVSSELLSRELENLKGDHSLITEGRYTLRLNAFLNRLGAYQDTTARNFVELQALKKELVSQYREELKLHEFKPRVLSSFVRNQLIDQVYFPLIGANLAKQIGTTGDSKRTDLMGLLLLVSPPGYGKTTLMEYIASRLGVIFMKINGPAIGHEVTSLDPADAPNAASAEELQKLNLSFEMGNNVMIYLDDIQHCNPEFLQKFISMCDAQRKIEGVYKGKTKTYDFRGKKVCVVMAGNPYTESGDKFQIPDMLSNRADIYNLGDVIGDTQEAFKLSYIENSLTSKPNPQ